MARKANLKKGIKGPQKMRYQMGGDFMEPDKELKFGGLYEKGGFKKKQKGGAKPPIPDGTSAKPGLPQSAYSDAAKAAAAKYGPSRGQGVARPATPTSAYMAASDKATGRFSAPAAKPKSSGFSDAFAAARKAGKTTFTYNGKSYGTRKAGETQEQYRAALGKASGTSSKPTSMQPVQRREAGQVSRQQPTLQTPNPPKPVATNKINSSSSNKKQMGGMVKGNKMTAKPPMKPIGKKNNTKTTKL